MTKTAPELRVYEATDGYRPHYRHWRPARQVRGRIVCLHGIQSHGGWFEQSSRRLCEAGFEVFFPDRRGSGLNAEDRGHAPSAELLINDVCRLVEPLRGAVPPVPILLLGVSWGGKLALVFALRYPDLIDGLGLLYPGLFPRAVPNPIQRLMLRTAGALGLKHRSISIPFNDPTLFTDVPRHREAIAQDSRALDRVTVGFLLESLRLDRIVQQSAGELRLPTLLMLAGQDQIVDNACTKQFFETLPTPNKTLIEYPRARHTLEFEADAEPFFHDLVGWCRTTTGQSLLRARAAAATP